MRAGSQISSTFLATKLAGIDITVLAVGIAGAQAVYAAAIYNLKPFRVVSKSELKVA